MVKVATSTFFKGTTEITSDRASVMASGGTQETTTVYKTSSGDLKIQQINGLLHKRLVKK